MEDSLVNKLRRPSIEIGAKTLGLPPSNRLIPKNFDLKPRDPKHSEKPVLLRQWADTDLWY